MEALPMHWAIIPLATTVYMASAGTRSANSYSQAWRPTTETIGAPRIGLLQRLPSISRLDPTAQTSIAIKISRPVAANNLAKKQAARLCILATFVLSFALSISPSQSRSDNKGT